MAHGQFQDPQDYLYTENVDVTAPYEYVDTKQMSPGGLSPELLALLRANQPEMIPPGLDTELNMPQQDYGPNQADAGGMMSSLMQPSGGSSWADASQVLAGLAGGEKANRLSSGPLIQGYDQLMLQAQRDKASTEGDALKKLAITKYLTSGGSKFDMSSLPYQYGGPPTAPSEAQVTGATSLQDQLLKRLEPGGTYTPQDHKQYSKPGMMEKIGQYGGVATGGIGTIDELMKRGGGGEAGGVPWGKVASGLGKGLKAFGGLFKRG